MLIKTRNISGKLRRKNQKKYFTVKKKIESLAVDEIIRKKKNMV